jgi:hypothetical protein
VAAKQRASIGQLEINVAELVAGKLRTLKVWAEHTTREMRDIKMSCYIALSYLITSYKGQLLLNAMFQTIFSSHPPPFELAPAWHLQRDISISR